MYVMTKPSRCGGNGFCASLVPTVFAQDDETAKVIVLNEMPTASESDAVLEAVRQCPTGAIAVAVEEDE